MAALAAYLTELPMDGLAEGVMETISPVFTVWITLMLMFCGAQRLFICWLAAMPACPILPLCLTSWVSSNYLGSLIVQILHMHVSIGCFLRFAAVWCKPMEDNK